MLERTTYHLTRALLSAAIAASLGSVGGASAMTPRPAGVLDVTNCDDSGSGSLRDTVASAVSGDTIDLADMGCSTLTLTTGAIVVPQDDLIIEDSDTTGRAAISAGYTSRVLQHTGAGTLEIDDLVIEQGEYAVSGYAYGGCVYSGARVVLNHSVVSHCHASSQNRQAGGGGIAAHQVGIYGSEISDNDVQSYGFAFSASGGGIESSSGTVSYSAILRNATTAPDTTAASGGGIAFLMSGGSILIDHTLIAWNASSESAGGVSVENIAGGVSMQMIDSTVYANAAANWAGGIFLSYINTELRNVTVANNVTLNSNPSGPPGAPAIFSYQYHLTISSSIISNNVTENVPGDGQIFRPVGATALDHDVVFGAPGVTLPAGTLTGDPLLLPLANNGGQTQTMALRSDSPALDQGIAADFLTSDQRGLGFLRLAGVAVDIGAFERQGPADGDYISVGGFDPP